MVWTVLSRVTKALVDGHGDKISVGGRYLSLYKCNSLCFVPFDLPSGQNMLKEGGSVIVM